jgi:hypothetical protein
MLHATTPTNEIIYKRIINDCNIQSFSDITKTISWENVLFNTMDSYIILFSLYSQQNTKKLSVSQKDKKKKN